jgi:hypothetical protein
MLKDVFHESRTNLILGQKGSGKTNVASVLIKELSNLGYSVWTNIHFFDYKDVGKACNLGKLPVGVTYQRVPGNVHVFSSLTELLYGLLEPGPKAVFLDEAGIVAHTGTSKSTTTVKKLAYIIRHFDCALTLITQVATSVPPHLREELVDFQLKVEKEGKRRILIVKEREVALDEFENEYINFRERKSYDNIPKSVLPYDGDFPSTLRFDIDLDEALSELGKLKSSIELETKGKGIINDLIGVIKTPPKPPGEKETMKDKIYRIRDEHLDWTQQQIADEVGSSQYYVSKVLKDRRIDYKLLKI